MCHSRCVMYPKSRRQMVPPQAPLEGARCGKKKEGMGYDTYPAFKPEEPAHRRARRLLDKKSNGEPNAVGQNADKRK